jgi:hypothetical protein
VAADDLHNVLDAGESVGGMESRALQEQPCVRDGTQAAPDKDLGDDAADPELAFQLEGRGQVAGRDLQTRLGPGRSGPGLRAGLGLGRRRVRAGYKTQWRPRRDVGLRPGGGLRERLAHGEERMSRPRRIRKARLGLAQRPYAPLQICRLSQMLPEAAGGSIDACDSAVVSPWAL